MRCHYVSEVGAIRRREFIALLGAAVSPLAAHAQSEVPVIGFLSSLSSDYASYIAAAFRQGVTETGFAEGRGVKYEYRYANGDYSLLATMTDELVRRRVAVIAAGAPPAALAAKKATSTIPIVFLHVGDPVAVGLIESLSRPGQNATGFSDILADLSGKLVDLAQELTKPQTAVGYLWHTAWPDGQNRYRSTEQAARVAGINLQAKGIADIAELDSALTDIKQSGATTLIVQPSPFTFGQRGRIIASAMRNGLGTIYAFPVAAREGSLMAYGPDYLHMYSRAPFYVGKILKGTKPADLPVELPARINLLVNLKTAKRLGVEVPLSLLIRADDLIE